MGRVVPLGLLTATVFVLVSLPTFVIVEVLLPQASGFPMLTLILAPMMLLCAYLMAFRQTLLLGYMAVLYFFTATGVQNRMAYNPIGFVNLTIAALLACGLGIALWAVVAPDSPPKQRLRFVRATTKAMRSLRDAGDGAVALAASKAPSAARWFDSRASSTSPTRRTRPASRSPSRCSAPAASSPAARPPAGVRGGRRGARQRRRAHRFRRPRLLEDTELADRGGRRAAARRRDPGRRHGCVRATAFIAIF